MKGHVSQSESISVRRRVRTYSSPRTHTHARRGCERCASRWNTGGSATRVRRKGLNTSCPGRFAALRQSEHSTWDWDAVHALPPSRSPPSQLLRRSKSTARFTGSKELFETYENETYVHFVVSFSNHGEHVKEKMQEEDTLTSSARTAVVCKIMSNCLRRHRLAVDIRGPLRESRNLVSRERWYERPGGGENSTK